MCLCVGSVSPSRKTGNKTKKKPGVPKFWFLPSSKCSSLIEGAGTATAVLDSLLILGEV